MRFLWSLRLEIQYGFQCRGAEERTSMGLEDVRPLVDSSQRLVAAIYRTTCEAMADSAPTQTLRKQPQLVVVQHERNPGSGCA